jgi:hypothetical protein
MVELKHPRQIKILEPFFLFALITILLIYAINVLNTEDWLWFISRSVDAHPNRIVVWLEGEKIVIQPGHEHFTQLSEAAHHSLHDFNNTNLIDIGFGEDTLTYYESNGVLVELFFDQPVEFHAPFRTGEPTQLLVPVNGRHAGHDYFFRGSKGEWWFGAMRMTDSSHLLSALSALGYVNQS